MLEKHYSSLNYVIVTFEGYVRVLKNIIHLYQLHVHNLMRAQFKTLN